MKSCIIALKIKIKNYLLIRWKHSKTASTENESANCNSISTGKVYYFYTTYISFLVRGSWAMSFFFFGLKKFNMLDFM